MKIHAIFLLCGLAVLCIVIPFTDAQIVTDPNSVPQWSVLEITLTANAKKSNPYLDGPTVTATFTGPSGSGITKTVKGFWSGNNANGNNIFKIRFAPTVKGTWTYTTTSSDAGLTISTKKSIIVVDPQVGNEGFVRYDASSSPPNPHHFFFDSGKPYFMFGQTYYEILLNVKGNGDWKIAIDNNDAYKINKIRMHLRPWADTEAGGKTTTYPDSEPFVITGTNPLKVNHDKLDLTHWKNAEQVIQYLYSKGMYADIILFSDSPHSYGTLTQDQRYVRYAISRFAAYPNVLWTLTNEWQISEREFGKGWSYWDGMGNIIRSEDPWSKEGNKLRALSIHPSTTEDFLFFKNPTTGTLVTWPSHAILQYGRSGTYSSFLDMNTNAIAIKNLDSPDNNRKIPIVNDEFGYIGEFGSKGETDARLDHRQAIWGVVLAGGYATTGDASAAPAGGGGSSGNSHVFFSSNWLDHPREYGDIKRLTNFFTTKGIEYWKMKPQNTLVTSGPSTSTAEGTKFRVYVLGEDKKNYIVYSAKGDFTLNIPAPTSGVYKVTRYNPRDATETALFDYSGGSKSFDMPDTQDWVLLLKVSTTSCTPSTEICDLKDNDCDKIIDERCDVMIADNTLKAQADTPMFSKTSTSSIYWSDSSSSSGSYATTSIYSRKVGAKATWKFPDIVPGTYKICAWWTGGSSRVDVADYEVYDGVGSTTTIRVSTQNQRTNRKDCVIGGNTILPANNLGTTLNPTFTLSSPSAKVELRVKVDDGTHIYIADAIGLERVTSTGCTDSDNDGHTSNTCGGDDCDDTNANKFPGNPEICGNNIDEDCSGSDLTCSPTENKYVIDNEDSTGFSKTGTWSVSGYPNPYKLNSIYAKSNTPTATWSFSNIQSGSYDVYAWWTSGSGRVDNAPYKINYNGGSATIRVNQKLNGGQWNRLGTTSFNFGTTGSVVLTAETSLLSTGADAVCLVTPGGICPFDPSALIAPAQEIIRGDTNDDGIIDIADPIQILGWLFQSQKKPEACTAGDVNNDGRIDIADAIYILNYLFKGGDAPNEGKATTEIIRPCADDS